MTTDKKASIHVNESNPVYGGTLTVTFDAGAHTVRTDCGVNLIVSQNGTPVLTSGGWPVTDTRIGNSPYPFVLNGGQWHGGAAQGRVELFDEQHDKKVIASQDFAIGA